MEARTLNTPEGVIIQVRDNDALTVSHIPVELSNDEETAPIAEKAKRIIETHLKAVANSAEVFKDEHEAVENEKSIERLLPDLRALLNDARELARRHAVADAKLLEPATQYDGVWETLYIGRIEALPVAERPAALANLTYQQSSALVRHGDLDRLAPDPVADAVRHRHRILGHMERSGLSANFPKRPTAENPLAVGPDTAAAFAEAEAGVKRHERRGERVKLTETLLKGKLNVLGATVRKPGSAIWEKLGNV